LAALAISAQTVKGAAEMLMEEQIHPEQLIDRVTTQAVPLQV
jgi:pyrroline-5-carboxylate reductase